MQLRKESLEKSQSCRNSRQQLHKVRGLTVMTFSAFNFKTANIGANWK